MSNKRSNQSGAGLSPQEREQLNRLEAKRHRFEGDRHDSKSRSGGIRPAVLITVGAIVLAVVFVALFVFRTGDGGASTASAATVQQVAATTAAVENGKVTISVDEVKSKKLVYWDYKKANGQTTALMAYVTPSGAVKMAVRLCEPCNGYSFRTEGNQIVCNTCGTRWDLETSKGISGGCQGYPPDVLKSIIEGGKITVDEGTVNSWKARI
jgi:uncharacterized protein